MVNISKALNLNRLFGKPAATVAIPLRADVADGGKVINFVEKASRNKVKVQFPEQSAFQSYPATAQKELQQACQHLSDTCNDVVLSYLKNLGKLNPNYEHVLRLVNNPKELAVYVKAKSLFSKQFVPGVKGKVPEIIRQNLAMMAVHNPESLKVLLSSKGGREIADKRLDILYLKDITPGTKVDGDFFYNLFDRIEKGTTKRLQEIKGLDSSFAQKYLKSFDDEICRDVMFSEKLVKELEQSKNIELTNKILKKFEKGMDVYKNDIRDLLKKSESNPELVNKVLDMKDCNPAGANFILKCLSGDSCSISSDMLDYLVKYQQKNSDFFKPHMINAADRFLSISNKDEQFLKTLLKLGEDKKLSNLEDILYTFSPNNSNYLKHNMNIGKLDDEVVAKMQMMSCEEMFQSPENWSIADKIYKETYLPVQNLFKGKANITFAEKYAAQNLSDMRINNPENYKKINDLGILDLIMQKRINPRIISGFRNGRDFTPEVYADLEMLKNGESIIKKFDNFDKILTKTKAGDVASVNGKLYINNNGRLEHWNMTEEKFNELFPLVDRYTTLQGRGDCYLISAMDSLLRNPNSRGSYYKMFEQKGNDIYVTIPAYKGYKGEIKFPNGEIKTTDMSADGAKHIQMVEQTYARTALRGEVCTPIGKDPLTTDDLNYLVERNNAGQSGDVMQEVLMFNNKVQRNNPSRKIVTINCNNPSKESVHKFFSEYSRNPNVIFNIGLISSGRNSGHAVQLKSYDADNRTFQIIDPRFCGIQDTYYLEGLVSDLSRIWKAELK